MIIVHGQYPVYHKKGQPYYKWIIIIRIQYIMMEENIMLNKVNKILKKYDVELEEGIIEFVKLMSIKDFQRFAKLDKRILDSKVNPSVYDLIHSREEMYAGAFINVKNNRIDVFIFCVYIPLDLEEERFNRLVGLFVYDYFYPSYVNRKSVKGRDFLCLEWDS